MSAGNDQDESRLRLVSELVRVVSDPTIHIDEALETICRRAGETLADACFIFLDVPGCDEPQERARWLRPGTHDAAPTEIDRIAVAIGSEEHSGRMVLERTRPDSARFGSGDIAIAEHVARLAGFAIQNAHFIEAYQAAARTRRQAEADRDEAQELLDRTEQLESMGRLAGAVAHDFNNLLAVMMGSSSVLAASTPPEDPAASQVAAISVATERAAVLTRQLLAFSRQQVLAPRTVEPSIVLADLEQMIRPVIGEDIELSVRAEPSSWRIHVDRGQLDLALVNLVVNARDSMPHGGKLRIEASCVTMEEAALQGFARLPAGDYVRFAITDTGHGIDPALHDRVFEPFFTTKPRSGGTGLGLPTALGIAHQSGGDIRFQSQVGWGTTFEVLIPRHIERAR